MVGDYADALAILERFPKSYTPATYVYRTAALAAFGRADEAKDAWPRRWPTIPASVWRDTGQIRLERGRAPAAGDDHAGGRFPVCATVGEPATKPDFLA